jgi:hypothetical protein
VIPVRHSQIREGAAVIMQVRIQLVEIAAALKNLKDNLPDLFSA